jgi:hypothetical protein
VEFYGLLLGVNSPFDTELVLYPILSSLGMIHNNFQSINITVMQPEKKYFKYFFST